MINELTIISFYTDSWEYKKHADNLKNQIKRHNLNYIIEERQDTGEWLSNTRIKPQFIFETFLKAKSPILWIDVDGSLLKNPVFIKDNLGKYDFMGRHQRTGPQRTWHVGTMFFDYNDKSKELLELWANSASNSRASDEFCFDNVWNNNYKRLNLSFKELPETYFQIIKYDGEISPKTVIAHRLSKCPSKMDMKKRNAKKISQS